MLSINDLKNGSLVMIEGAPYEVLEIAHQHIGRGGSSAQTKIRNVKTGQVLSRNFKPSDQFEEADIEKRKITYLYGHRGSFVFVEGQNQKNRFTLAEEKLGDKIKWLKPNIEVEAMFLGAKSTNDHPSEEIIGIKLPIKIDYKVKEAPPGVRGDTAQGGSKTVVLETGAEVLVPLFINEDDIVRINTETGEYVERVSKA